ERCPCASHRDGEHALRHDAGVPIPGRELLVRGDGIELLRSAILLLATYTGDCAGRAALPCDRLSGGNSPGLAGALRPLPGTTRGGLRAPRGRARPGKKPGTPLM